MQKVAFISADWGTMEDGTLVAGGSCFHRVIQPAESLKKYAGWDVVVADKFSQHSKTGAVMPIVDGEALDGYDTIVFQRWMHQSAIQVTERAQRAGQIVVQDVDDWYWGLATSNHAFMASHPKVNPEVNRNHYLKALAKADFITVSTMYLAKRLEHLKRPIALLPNMINMEMFTPYESTQTDKPTIGWVGAVPWRSGDLETLKGFLGPFMRKHGLEWRHGGHRPDSPSALSLMGMEDIPSATKPMVPIEQYPTLFEGIDIFVAPLSERPFNEAKSNVKLMECSAAGVPYVAQDFGPYHLYDGGGAVAKRPKDWTRELTRLLDPTERYLQRQRQLERVSQEDITLRWSDWERTYLTANTWRAYNLSKIMNEAKALNEELSRREKKTPGTIGA